MRSQAACAPIHEENEKRTDVGWLLGLELSSPLLRPLGFAAVHRWRLYFYASPKERASIVLRSAELISAAGCLVPF